MEYNLNTLLQKVTVSLAAFLEKVLPTLLEDWWKQAVVYNLSIQQQSRIKQRNINSLAALDLAALLRVIDQNWFQISNKLNLTSETVTLLRRCKQYETDGHIRILKAFR